MDGVWEVVIRGDCLLGLFEYKRTRRLERDTFRQSERLRVIKGQTLWCESSYKSKVDDTLEVEMAHHSHAY